MSVPGKTILEIPVEEQERMLLINVNYFFQSHCLSIFVTDEGVVAS